MNNKYVGSSLDELLDEDGVLEAVEAVAVKRVIAYELRRALEERGLTQTWLAAAMNTSRQAVSRLLNPEYPSSTLPTVCRAARALGMRLTIVPEPVCKGGQRLVQRPESWQRQEKGQYDLRGALKGVA